MRIISWNCNGALRRKYHLLQPLNPDLLIIQECEDPAKSADIAYQQWAHNHLWAGKNSSKGLGVFANDAITLRPLALPSQELELFLPVDIANWRLLAVWTKQANSPTFPYIGQLYKWLQRYKEHLSSSNTLIIGDFNSNTRWDKWDRWWNHSDVVHELNQLGLDSLYHRQMLEKQGAETQPTFFMHRNITRPYHIDYAFLSNDLLSHAHLSIGNCEEWLSYSDHLPLIIDINTTTQQQDDASA